MFCHSCGIEIGRSARCAHCGKEVKPILRGYTYTEGELYKLWKTESEVCSAAVPSEIVAKPPTELMNNIGNTQKTKYQPPVSLELRKSGLNKRPSKKTAIAAASAIAVVVFIVAISADRNSRVNPVDPEKTAIIETDTQLITVEPSVTVTSEMETITEEPLPAETSEMETITAEPLPAETSEMETITAEPSYEETEETVDGAADPMAADTDKEAFTSAELFISAVERSQSDTGDTCDSDQTESETGLPDASVPDVIEPATDRSTDRDDTASPQMECVDELNTFEKIGDEAGHPKSMRGDEISETQSASDMKTDQDIDKYRPDEYQLRVWKIDQMLRSAKNSDARNGFAAGPKSISPSIIEFRESK